MVQVLGSDDRVAARAASAPTPRARMRRLQVQMSLRHYLHELKSARTVTQVFEWFWYKFPTSFPLRSHPLALTIEVTNDCNFKCPHCPRNELNSDRDVGFMPLELFNKIASESAGRVSRFKFIGLGEPSLHPQISEMLSSAAKLGIRTTLYTNGTLFERFSPDEICALDIERIVVSIDGLDERQFAKLRVGGNYHLLRQQLSAFMQHRSTLFRKRPIVELRHVIVPGEGAKDLRRFINEWAPSFVDTVKFNHYLPPYRTQKSTPKRGHCRDILRELHPRFDGRVPLCGYDGQREWIGDLTKMKLDELWRGKPLDKVRRLHRRRDLTDLPACRTCQFR